MKKNLSAFGLLWISLTSMIGSGWLFGSLYSAHFAGPAAIIAWPFASFLLLFVALAYAEVGTMFPQADSLALLPFYTHGRLTSVMMSGLGWLSLATIPVIETQGLVQYASNYLPHLVIKSGIYYSISPRGYFFAIVLLMSFVLLNYFGIRFFARINTAFTVWKLIIPAITIISLLIASYHADNFSHYGGFMPYGWKGVMAAISSGGALFSLLGFRQVIIMMSDIENPGKYVPIVLVASLVFTGILYTCLQWAFIGSLRGQDLIHGWANLTFPGDAGPFAALAAIAGLIWLSILLYSDAFISPYSTALVYSTTASRMLASMSVMKDMPAAFARKNKYQAHWISLITNFLLAVLMFSLLDNWQAMSSFLVAVSMVSYAIGPICLICLRKQLPHFQRPFRLRFSGLIAFIGFYVCTAGTYWSGEKSVLKLLVLTLLGLIIYLFYYGVFRKLERRLDGKESIWLLCYLFGLGIFSYFGNYGGKHLIPLHWDMLFLMIFSALIFLFAFTSKKSNEHVNELCKQPVNLL